MPLQTRSENVENSCAPEDDAPVGNFDRSSIINNNLISIAGGRAGFPMPDPCEP